MGIRFLCDTCGKKLNIKEELAGKKGRCPKCDAVITIPTESTLPASEKPKAAEDKAEAVSSVSEGETKAKQKPVKPGTSASTSSKPASGNADKTKTRSKPEEQTPSPPPLPVSESQETPADDSHDESDSESRESESREAVSAPTDVLAEYPNAQWFVRPSSGGQFGPAASDVMKTWLGEGRIGRDSLVWCEGWEEWQPASEVFASELGGPPSPPSESKETDTKEISGTPQLNRAFSHQQARQRARAMGIFLVVALALVSIALAVTLFIVVNNSAKEKDKNKEDNQGKNESARLFFELPKNHNLESGPDIVLGESPFGLPPGFIKESLG